MITVVMSAALRGTGILAIAWIATALLRRSSADLRHRIWVTALCSLVVFLIPWSVPEAAQVTVFYSTSASAGLSLPASAPIPWEAVWITGVLLFIAQFAVRVASLARISDQAIRTESAGIRITSAIASPLTWGVVRPIILLPSYATEWSPSQREYALQHERFHIARADWLWQSLAMFVRAIFWFHPLVWLGVARVRAEAEHAVDDAVLTAGAPASGYAEQLLDVARHMSSPSAAAAVSMVHRPKLTARITTILDASRRRAQASVRVRAAILFTALGLVPMLAAVRSGTLEPLAVPKFQAPNWVYQPNPAPLPRPRPRLIAQTTPQPNPTPQPQPAPKPVEPVKIGPGVTPPKAISFGPEPAYTEEAKEAGLQGEVWIRCVVNEEGVPTELVVTQALGLGLDEQAMLAVSQWRFQPGMKDGVAVPVIATIAVKFHLL